MARTRNRAVTLRISCFMLEPPVFIVLLGISNQMGFYHSVGKMARVLRKKAEIDRIITKSYIILKGV
jgi:hypothetical protein